MEIKTLKDLKEAIKDIPDDALDKFGAGVDEGDNWVALLYWDGEDPSTGYAELTEKYPVLEDIGKWINNIVKVQDQFEIQEELGTEEPISSEDTIEIKPRGESSLSSQP